MFEERCPLGCGERRAWPDVSPAQLDWMIVARGLQQMNLALNVADNHGLASYVARHAERVRAWMRSPGDRWT
jgi:hypothetical protein